MPAFVAHFLIAKDVFSITGLEDTEKNQQYFCLGSVGPDLPYYSNVVGTAFGTFFEEKYNPDSPGFYSSLGDYFHAKTPNLVPMKLLETIRKDKDKSNQDQKLAYALGYLTHMAADQRIHPVVEEYAGPFYVSGLNRKKHRILEVYQDILLYGNKNPGNKFFDEGFISWFDISPPKEVVTSNDPSIAPLTVQKIAPDWFGSFIQRSFLEAYGSIIDGDEAEKWIKGFTSIFRMFEGVGPYHDAYDDIEKNTPEAKDMVSRFNAKKTGYLLKCFDPAVELSKKYIAAANNFFQSKEISDQTRAGFLSSVPDADLTGPLMTI
jgi:hypothetical protein